MNRIAKRPKKPIPVLDEDELTFTDIFLFLSYFVATRMMKIRIAIPHIVNTIQIGSSTNHHGAEITAINFSTIRTIWTMIQIGETDNLRFISFSFLIMVQLMGFKPILPGLRDQSPIHLADSCVSPIVMLYPITKSPNEKVVSNFIANHQSFSSHI